MDTIKILSCGQNCVGVRSAVVARGDAGADETIVDETIIVQ